MAPMDNSPHAQGHTISHEAIYTWIYAHPKKTLIEHGICLPSRRWMRKKPPAGGRKPPIVGMRLIDERPDIADRMIPGNWEGDLIIGKDGASACATLVERTTRYPIIVALPLRRGTDQVCNALTRRIQGPTRRNDANTDTGPKPRNGPPPAPHPRHWRGGVCRSPPQPLGERNQRKHQPTHPPLPTQGTPNASHQPYLDAIAYELNNCPRATLGYRTPTSIQPTHCYHPLTPPSSSSLTTSFDSPTISNGKPEPTSSPTTGTSTSSTAQTTRSPSVYSDWDSAASQPRTCALTQTAATTPSTRPTKYSSTHASSTAKTPKCAWRQGKSNTTFPSSCSLPNNGHLPSPLETRRSTRALEGHRFIKG